MHLNYTLCFYKPIINMAVTRMKGEHVLRAPCYGARKWQTIICIPDVSCHMEGAQMRVWVERRAIRIRVYMCRLFVATLQTLCFIKQDPVHNKTLNARLFLFTTFSQLHYYQQNQTDNSVTMATHNLHTTSSEQYRTARIKVICIPRVWFCRDTNIIELWLCVK